MAGNASCKNPSPELRETFFLNQIMCSIKEMVAGAAISPGFGITEYDEITITYIGATNNMDTVTYEKAGVTVATLTFTYVNGGAADNDLIETVTKS